MPLAPRPSSLGLSLVLFAYFVVNPAFGAVQLQVGSDTTGPGGTAYVQVQLASDTNIVAAQFDVVCADTNLAIGELLGGPASALHQMLSGAVAPGIRRVVISSPTNATLGAGVLAEVPIAVPTNTADGAVAVWVTNIVLADYVGQPVTPVSAVLGSVTVDHNYQPGPPVILAQPTNLVVPLGFSATLSVTGNGTSPLRYQWQKSMGGGSWSDVSSATAPTFSFQLSAFSFSGDYRCVVTNSVGAVTSEVATLSVVNVAAWGAYGNSVPDNVTNAVAIAAGSCYLALRGDGTVAAWPDAGESEVQRALTNAEAIVAGTWHYLALRTDGSIIGWGNSFYDDTVAPAGLSNVVAIAAGAYHSVALRADGTVAVWGGNMYGQTNMPPGLHDIVRIAAGGDHTLALRTDGRVVAWGLNDTGQTAVPSDLSNVVAIACGNQHSLALQSDGRLVVWGANDKGQSDVPVGLSNIVAFAGGEKHTAALRADGTVFAWGQYYLDGGAYAPAGNIPVGLSNAVAVACGGAILSALIGTGVPAVTVQPWNRAVMPGQTAWFCAKAAGAGQLSYQWQKAIGSNQWAVINGANSSQFSIIGPQLSDAGEYRCVITNAVGAVTSAVATLSVMNVAAWGAGMTGITGEYHRGQAIVPGNITNATAISAGAKHSMVLQADGTVAVWGNSGYGETNVPISLANVVAITSGSYHCLALKQDRTVTAWGFEDFGQVDVPPGLSNVIGLAGGFYHSLALKADGSVVGWGNNIYNQISGPMALRSLIAISDKDSGGMGLKADGRVDTWGYSASGQRDLPADLTNVVAIAAGVEHNLLLKADGTVVACGRYVDYAEGSYDYIPAYVPFGLSNVVAIAAGNHSLVLRSDGSIVAWGANNYGQTNVPVGLTNSIGIACGYYHSLALVGTGTPAITLQPWNRAVMPGQAAWFCAKAAGAGQLSYQWQKAIGSNQWSDVSNATNSTLDIFNASTAVAGDYRCVINNSLGGATSKVARLDVGQPLTFAQQGRGEINFEPRISNFEFGQTITLTASPARWYAFSHWQSNGVPLMGASTNLVVTIGLTNDFKAIFTNTVPLEQVALSFSPTPDFSITNGNPNGVWSYGWMPTDFSQFNLYTNALFDIYAMWSGGWNPDHTPNVYLVPGAEGAPDALTLHPGDGTQPSVVRWTATVDGPVTVTGQFLAGGFGGMLIAVRFNNQPWWQGVDAGAFNLSTQVVAGSTIDFAVFGAFHGGATPLEVTIAYPAVELPVGTPHIYVNGQFANSSTYLFPDTEPVEVRMQTSFTNGSILYTLDGTDPAGGLLCEGPLTLMVTAPFMLRAGVFNADYTVWQEADPVWFVPTPRYHLALATNGAGSIQSSVVSGQWSAGGYLSNSLVQLTATPIGKNLFVGWTGDVLANATNNPLLVTMDRARTIAANFLPLYTLTVASNNQGSVQIISVEGYGSESTGYLTNTLVTLSATSTNGWSFMHWTGNINATNNPLTVAMDRDLALQPVFGAPITVSPIGSGTVQREPSQALYAYGQPVRLTALPNAGNYFRWWGGAASGNTNSPLEFVVTNVNPIVSAVFAAVTGNNFALVLQVSGEGSVSYAPLKNLFASNETVTITATPAPGYAFAGWTGAINGADALSNPLAVTMNSNRTITATFELGTPPQITQLPANQNRELAQTATISAEASGSLPLAYQWWHNGAAISDATNSVLILTNLQAADAGRYFVVVTNLFGSITSMVALLTINQVTVDAGFNPEATGGGYPFVFSLVPQVDGKILAGGGFLNLAGQPCNSIGQLNADGSLNNAFGLGAQSGGISVVNAVAVQTDGKFIVGGRFATLAGATRNSLGRFNADGSLDSGFDPGANEEVFSVALQADGKILVGGRFTAMGGRTCNYLGRLNVDGTLDTDFNPGASYWVQPIAVQADGKILVGGGFAAMGGQTRNYLARLNADGTLDAAFDARADLWVQSLAVQADGKILVGGEFTALNGQSRSWFGRLNADGTLDNTFVPVVNERVWSLAIQTDGKIVMGGYFNNSGGYPRNWISRVNADGTLDTTFNPWVDAHVWSVAVQSDGKILVGGDFHNLGGQSRNRIGRLHNTEPATHSLILDGSTIKWWRGGSSPEVWRTTFEHSQDATNWTLLGPGTRIPGGWQLTGVSLPPGRTVRARGFVAGGFQSSAWFVEEYLEPPRLLSQPEAGSNFVGTLVGLNVTATGSEPLNYQWYKDGALVLSAPSSAFTITNLNLFDAGNYWVVVTNAYGSVTSSVATLTVVPVPIGGNVVAWGYNSHGQVNVPAGLTNVVMVTDGLVHSLALKADGQVMGWGAGSFVAEPDDGRNLGQLIYPVGLSNVVAIAAAGSSSLALKGDGTVLAWGYGSQGQTNVPSGLSNVVAIAAGNEYFVAVRADGTVVGWGLSNNGQTAVPTGLRGVVALAASSSTCAALKADGTLVVWGSNWNEQTNVPPGLTNVVAIAAGSSHFLALKADGTVAAWGGNEYGQINVPGGLNNVVAVSAGLYHSLALKADGTLVAWGVGGPGQVDHPHYGQSTVPNNLSNAVALGSGGGSYHNLVLVNPLPERPPDIFQQPQSFPILPKQDRVFVVSAVGTVPLRYQWYQQSPVDSNQWFVVSGATNSTLLLPNVPWGSNGNFVVVVSNHFGAVTSQVATLNVVPPYNMAYIPDGPFQMGDNFGIGTADERPVHTVNVSQFFMDKFEVTKALWDEVYSWAITNGYSFDNAGAGVASDHPVQTINWYDSVKWCNARSEKEGLIPAYYTDAARTNVYRQGQNDLTAVMVRWNSGGYRLPTEAEWEKAARGGLVGQYYPWPGTNGTYADNIDGNKANYGSSGDPFEQSVTQTTPVGFYANYFNGFGLYDVAGNVWEFCWDWYDSSWYSNISSTQNDTRGPDSGANRLYRGGSWGDTSDVVRCANRRYGYALPSFGNYCIGFRCVIGQAAADSAAPLITRQPQGRTNVVSASAAFSVAAVGVEPLYYQWQKSVVSGQWSVVGNATNSTLELFNLSTADSGDYRCVISNAFGSVTSAVARLTVIRLATDMPAGLVGWWPGDGNFADIVGTNHGTGMGGAGFAPGMVGQAYNFDGTNGYVDLGNSATFNLAEFTVETWAYLDPAALMSRSAVLVGKGTGWDCDGGFFLYISNGKLAFQVVSTCSIYSTAEAASPITSAGFYHVVGTFDGHRPRLFVSGALAANWNYDIPNVGANNYPLRIGAANWLEYDGTKDRFPGRIDEVSLYSRALSEAEISTLYSAGSVGKTYSTLPVVTLQPQGRTVSVGSPATLQVTARGEAPLRYQWHQSVFSNQWTLVAGATNSQLSVLSAQPGDAGDYRCVVSNAYGMATSAVATLEVIPVMGWGNFNPQTDLPGSAAVVGISAGRLHRLYLLNDGRVTGRGDYWTGVTYLPMDFTAGSNLLAVASGLGHSMGLTTGGTVVTWGYNYFGQRDVPAWLSNVVAIASGNNHCLALRSDGTVVAWGYNNSGQATVPADLRDVVAIAAGDYHSLALTASGQVRAWGLNAYGQADVPGGLSNVIAIAAGGYYDYGHSLALTADGRLVAWGHNLYGQSSVPANLSNVVAMAAGGYFNLALTAEGRVVGWGQNSSGQTNVPLALTNTVALAAGYHHSLALVGSGAPAITVQPWHRQVLAGQGVSLYAKAAGAGPLAYQWQKSVASGPWSEVSDATNSTIQLFNLSTGDAGDYRCIISNSLGVVTSKLARLEVGQPLSLTQQGRGDINFEPRIMNFEFGQTVTLTATPARWYAFARWSDDVTDNPRAVVIGLTNSYTAVFTNLMPLEEWEVDTNTVEMPVGTPRIFLNDELANDLTNIFHTNLPVSVVLTSSWNGPIHYTLDGSTPDFLTSPLYAPGTLLQVAPPAIIKAIAYANDLYLESALYEDYSMVVTSRLEYVPVYAVTAYTLGGGTVGVTGQTPGASNQLSAATQQFSNLVATATASSAPGWTFLGWSIEPGSESDAPALLAGNPLAITITSNTTLQAHFGTPVGASVVGSGTVLKSPDLALYPYGSTVRLTALPLAGRFLAQWSGAVTGPLSPVNLVVTSAAPAATATFGALGVGQFSLTVLASGEGTVSYAPLTNRFASNATVTLTAIPQPGHRFHSWSGPINGADPLTNTLVLTMNTSKVVTARFEVEGYPVITRITPASQSGQSGGTAAISVEADGAPPLHFSWYREGLLKTQTASTSLLFTNLSLLDAGRYHCVVSNAFGRATSAVVTLTVDGLLPPAGMALVPAGMFQMGDDSGEGSPVEAPAHNVQVSGFFMDRFEVTLALWEEVRLWGETNGYVFDNVAGGVASNHPAHSMSWHDAVKWCNARSQREGLTPAYYTDASQTSVYRTGQINLTDSHVKWGANGYRLPTEAEWEKAARGGLAGQYYPWPGQGGGFGNHLDGSRANYLSSGDPYETNAIKSTPVGYYDGRQIPAGINMANGFGLYDMAGNVWEWCWDFYDPSWYSNAQATASDTRGPSQTLAERVLRGGSSGDTPNNLRCSARDHTYPNYLFPHLGFRCVMGQNAIPGASPQLVLQPFSQTNILGGSASFSVAANGSAPFSYQWFFNGTNRLAETNGTLTLENVQPSQAGEYACVVTNAYGAATSQVARLEVYPADPAILVNGEHRANGMFIFTNQDSITITLLALHPHLHYTTDGTEPDPGSPQYTGPFTVIPPVEIRTLAYRGDYGQWSQVSTARLDFVPVFSLNISSPGGGAVQTGGGAYQPAGSSQHLSNTVATVAASNAPGWVFLGWSAESGPGRGETVLITNNPYSFTVTSNTSLVASFGTAISNSWVVAEFGVITRAPGLALYPYGSLVRHSAVPNAGKQFIRWTGAADGFVNSPLNFVVTNANPVVSGLFGTLQSNYFSLTLLVNGDGSVSNALVGNAFPSNTLVTISAQADPGNDFDGWSGGASGRMSPLSFRLTSNTTITASFVPGVATNIPPVVQLASPGDGASFTAPVSVNLFAQANDPGDVVVRVEFYADGQLLGLVTNAGASAVNVPWLWTNTPVGLHQLTAVAYDPAGLSATSAPVTISVQTAYPEVAIVNPTNGASFANPAGVAISALANDADDSLGWVSFHAGETLLGMVTNPPFTLVWSNPPAGQHLLTAHAVDRHGPTVTSAPVAVTILYVDTNTAVFRLAVDAVEVNESVGIVQVTVLKSGGPGASINYATAAGSASPWLNDLGDYFEASGTLTFTNGETAKTVAISIVNDSIYESAESFSFNLFGPGAGSSLGAPASATITLADDDGNAATNSLVDIRPPDPAPTGRGKLRVSLEPNGASGQWRFPWEIAWRDSGTVVEGLVPGNYPVESKPVNGYIQPPLTTVVVEDGKLASLRTYYLQTQTPAVGSLRVVLKPDSVAATARWRRQGEAEWHASGEIVPDLNEGMHLLEFSVVDGRQTPAPRPVEVVAGQLNSVEATYLLAETGSGTPPAVLQFSDFTAGLAQGWPYAYNGQLRSDVGYGSGFVVKERVVLTAAHVVFNDATLSFVSDAYWFFQRHAGDYEPKPQRARGWYVFSGYSARRAADNSPGESSPESQNLDAAALYFPEPAGRRGYGGYLSSDADPHAWLSLSRPKLLVGYPVENVPAQNRGRMHATPQAFMTFSRVLDKVYATTAIQSYPGNSGGPLCVQHTNGTFYPAAIYLGGSGQTVVRAIDSGVLDLINRAETSANGGGNNSGGGVVLLTPGTGGALFEPGFLQVILGPPDALAGGAGWRLVGHPEPTFCSENDAVLGLLGGRYAIEFKPVTGFISPTEYQLVRQYNIVAKQTTVISVNYKRIPPGVAGGVVLLGSGIDWPNFEPGFFNVRVTPQAAIAAGAGWQIEGYPGTNIFNNNDVWYGVQKGIYRIRFQPIAGFSAPPDCTVNLIAGGTYEITGDYLTGYLAAHGTDPNMKITAQPQIGNGLFTFGLAGQPGVTYILEATSDAASTNWTIIATNTMGPGGVWQFTDPSSTNLNSRYYRARQE